MACWEYGNRVCVWLTDTQTHIARPVLCFFFPVHSLECWCSNCHAGLHLPGISVSPPDKARVHKGVVWVARRPLAFMSLDAPQGSSIVWLAGRGWRWGNVRGSSKVIIGSFHSSGNCVSFHSHFSPLYATSISSNPSFFCFCRPPINFSPYMLCRFECTNRQRAAGWHWECTIKAVK